ncbi:type II secretion system F family protein [Aeromicrobium sp. CTD01-1L150]|uniref:type II secretion system F family protein n=1 Tax=Aeromicrobium sp. CTD01-1L150 TaxID=3341830 RepID=UPI0035C0FDB7
MTGVLLGAALGVGIVLLLSGWRHARRPSLESRVLPYVRDVHPSAPILQSGVAGAVLATAGHRLARWLDDVLGGAGSVRRRLDRLGHDGTVEDFRMRQVVWGASAFAGCAVASLVLWSGARTAALPLLVFCVAGFVAGALACDNHLSAQVRRHEERAAEEFPAVADLLALAVAAGESPVAGLGRVLRVAHGDLSHDLARVLADVRTGTPVSEAFLRLAARTGVPSIARFSEGLAVAVERGTPLVDVLHAQASDVRETARRQLIEAGGRKEIAMMLPVVFLVLPVTVIFAFFPGYIGLTMST